MKKRIYLDYAAATPLEPKVLKAMLPYLKRAFGNPSSSHSFGQEAKAAIENARARVAAFLHCNPLEVVFTSGATEANNLAMRGVVLMQNMHRPHVVTSQIEHESILSPCQELEAQGLAQVTYVAPDKDGIVQPMAIEKALKENTVLVSVMYANSEIGTVQPIAEIGQLLKVKSQKLKSKILFHTDAVQAAQFLDCNSEKLGVDMLTLSSHKLYGPKGAGVLLVKEGVVLFPLVFGGGQEQGMRSGTENVPAIVGMGEAIAEISNAKFQMTKIRIRQLRDQLIKTVLQTIAQCSLTGSLKLRLPNNAHFCFEGIEAHELLLALDQKGVAVSTGSACSEKTYEPSHVLLALGMSSKDAMSCIRITLGKYTTRSDIEKTIHILDAALAKLRRPVDKNIGFE